ncbi:hypothetical protein [Medusavirus stheno T3]|uniref:Uncharacterized protein n=1 Tax=Medusavirus stheno T3 TaxID=3069717 RepID=A0A7S8BDA3_9VIRU|nr:hypothetical protein QKU73_gp030 [Acanthamoeba castellanii medusavirus]QPB44211.1 hypothetical protein [Medusavirus stheno T3]
MHRRHAEKSNASTARRHHSAPTATTTATEACHPADELKRKALASLCMKHYAEQTAMLARHLKEQRELEQYLDTLY